MMFRIPADQQYFSILIGLLDALKFSRNFNRDDTDTGAALVSRTWQAALESQPIITIDCEDVMSYDTRVKPGFPWITQASTDGGVTWHDSMIQPNWAGYVPVLTLPSTPGAETDLAAQILRWLQSIAETINTGIADDEPKAETVQHVVDSLSQYAAGATIAPFVGSIYDAAIANPTEAAEAAEDCSYTDVFEYMKGTLEGAGAGLFNALSQIFEHTDTIVTTDIANTLFDLAGFLGAAAVRDISNASNPALDGSEFGASCDDSDPVTYSGHTYVMKAPVNFMLETDGSDHYDNCGFNVVILEGQRLEALYFEGYLTGDGSDYALGGIHDVENDCFTGVYNPIAPGPTVDYYWYGHFKVLWDDGSGSSIADNAYIDGLLAEFGLDPVDSAAAPFYPHGELAFSFNIGPDTVSIPLELDGHLVSNSQLDLTVTAIVRTDL